MKDKEDSPPYLYMSITCRLSLHVEGGLHVPSEGVEVVKTRVFRGRVTQKGIDGIPLNLWKDVNKDGGKE